MALYNITDFQITGMKSNSAIGAYQELDIVIETDILDSDWAGLQFGFRFGPSNLTYSDPTSSFLPASDYYYQSFKNPNPIPTYNLIWQSGSKGNRNKILSDNSTIKFDSFTPQIGGDTFIKIELKLYFQNLADVDGNWGDKSAPSTNPKFFLTKDSYSNSTELSNSFPSDIYSDAFRKLNFDFWLKDGVDVARHNFDDLQNLRFYNKSFLNQQSTPIEEISWNLTRDGQSVSDLSNLEDTKIEINLTKTDSGYPDNSIINNSNCWFIAIKTNSTDNVSSVYDSLEQSIASPLGSTVNSNPYGSVFNRTTGIFSLLSGSSSSGIITSGSNFKSEISIDASKLTVGDTYRFIFFVNLPNGGSLSSNGTSTQINRNDLTFISDEYEVVEDFQDNCDISDIIKFRRVDLCDYYSCYSGTPKFAPGERIKQFLEIDFTDYNDSSQNLGRNPFNLSNASGVLRVVVNGNTISTVSLQDLVSVQNLNIYSHNYEVKLPFVSGNANGFFEFILNIPQTPINETDVITVRQNFIISNADADLDINFEYSNGVEFSAICDFETENIFSVAEYPQISQSNLLENDTNYHASSLFTGNNPNAIVEISGPSESNMSSTDSLDIALQDLQFDNVNYNAQSEILQSSILSETDYEIYHYRKSLGYGLDISNDNESVIVQNISPEYDIDSFWGGDAMFETTFYLKEISRCVIFSKYSQDNSFGFEFGINSANKFYFSKLENGVTIISASGATVSLGWNHIVLRKLNQFLSTPDDFISQNFYLNGFYISSATGNTSPSQSASYFPTHSDIFGNTANTANVNDGSFVLGNRENLSLNSAKLIFSSFYLYNYSYAQGAPMLDFVTRQFDKGINRTPENLGDSEKRCVLALRFNKANSFSVCDFSKNANFGSLNNFGNRTILDGGAWVIK